MRYTIFIIIILLLSDLTYSQNEINIQSDFSSFSKQMENGDTLRINWTLNICETERSESDLITKRNDSIYIRVSGIEDRVDFNYEETIYQFDKNDSLNFEDLFHKLANRENTRKRKTKPIEIVFQKDTLAFYTGGLMEILYVSNYMWKIKDRIYWDKEYYKPLKFPEEPIGLTEEEKLDSIMKLENEKELERIINNIK